MEVTFNKACNELEGKPTSFDLCHGHPVNRPTVLLLFLLPRPTTTTHVQMCDIWIAIHTLDNLQ